MVLLPHDIYIMDKICVRHAVYLQILIIEDIYFSNQGYAELLADQSLDGIFVRAFTHYIRLDAEAAI